MKHLASQRLLVPGSQASSLTTGNVTLTGAKLGDVVIVDFLVVAGGASGGTAAGGGVSGGGGGAGSSGGNAVASVYNLEPLFVENMIDRHTAQA